MKKSRGSIYITAFLICPQAPAGFIAVHSWHTDIEQNKVRQTYLNGAQGNLAVVDQQGIAGLDVLEVHDAPFGLGDHLLADDDDVAVTKPGRDNDCIADMARATAAAVAHWPSRQALIVADNCTYPPDAIATVSANPARALGLADRGEIAIGKRADLVQVRMVLGQPVVRAVWREGLRVG